MTKAEITKVELKKIFTRSFGSNSLCQVCDPYSKLLNHSLPQSDPSASLFLCLTGKQNFIVPSFTEKFLVVLFAAHCLPKLIRQIVSYFIFAYVALNVDILFGALSGIYKQTVLIKCLFHLLEGLLANVRGSARFNRVGGAYQNGKPIPEWLRRKMISLA